MRIGSWKLWAAMVLVGCAALPSIREPVVGTVRSHIEAYQQGRTLEGLPPKQLQSLVAAAEERALEARARLERQAGRAGGQEGRAAGQEGRAAGQEGRAAGQEGRAAGQEGRAAGPEAWANGEEPRAARQAYERALSQARLQEAQARQELLRGDIQRHPVGFALALVALLFTGLVLPQYVRAWRRTRGSSPVPPSWPSPASTPNTPEPGKQAWAHPFTIPLPKPDSDDAGR